MLKGLLMKEYFSMKKSVKMLFAFAAIYFVMGIATGNMGMLGGVLMIVCMMLPVNSMSTDEYYKWDRFALTMPISRKDAVLGKYALILVLGMVTFVLNLLCQGFTEGSGWFDALLVSSLLLGVGLSYTGFVMPFIYRFGAERGRWLIILLAAGMGGLIAFGATSLSENHWLLSVNPVLLLLCGLLFAAAIFIGSFLISVKIYTRKEF